MCTCAPHLHSKDAVVLQEAFTPHTSYIVGNTVEHLYSEHHSDQKFCSKVFLTQGLLAGRHALHHQAVEHNVAAFSELSLSLCWQGMLYPAKTKLVVLTTECLPWLQTNWRDSDHERLN